LPLFCPKSKHQSQREPRLFCLPQAESLSNYSIPGHLPPLHALALAVQLEALPEHIWGQRLAVPEHIVLPRVEQSARIQVLLAPVLEASLRPLQALPQCHHWPIMQNTWARFISNAGHTDNKVWRLQRAHHLRSELQAILISTTADACERLSLYAEHASFLQPALQHRDHGSSQQWHWKGIAVAVVL